MATAARRPGFDRVRQIPLLFFIALYTLVTGGPLLWVAAMSLRTTAEIFKSPYGFPSPAHWEKFADAWTSRTARPISGTAR
jgi:ABC-type glycerol-3-phosphate transport system permease component